MAKSLPELTISNEGGNYLLNIRTNNGETIELKASYEQLDEDEDTRLVAESEA